MNLYLYKSTAERNRLDKTSYLTAYATITGTLKESTSITNPVITIENNGFPQCNYAYITEFSRYYFIDEIISIHNNLWQLSMSVDVLMSFKGSNATSGATGIYALNGFVARQENLTDTEIVDSLYPVHSKSNVTTVLAQPYGTSVWHGSDDLLDTTNDLSSYRYLWRTGGALKTSGGGVMNSHFPLAMVIMSAREMSTLLPIFAETRINTANDKTLSDYTYDMYCLPMPFVYNNALTADKLSFTGIFSSDFTLPQDTFNANKYYAPIENTLNTITTLFSATFTTPGNSLWQCYSPYTSVIVNFLPFGQFQLDTSIIWNSTNYSNETTIYFKIVTDPMSGNAALYYGRNYNACYHYLGTSNVSIQLPTNTSALNGSRIAAGALTVAGSIAAAIATDGGSAVASAIGAATGAVNLATSCMNPNTSITGGEQKIIDVKPRVTVLHHEIPTLAPNLFGKPCCKNETVKNMTGYTQFSRVHVEGTGFETATSAELGDIESMLINGIIV